MSRKTRSKRDSIEQKIALALRPGAFISDRACFSFVTGVEGVTHEITRLTEADPARGVALFDTILAACHEKAEEVDDSSGYFGQFVRVLFWGWVRARQSAGADRDETAARLFDWIERDPFGFWMRLDQDITEGLDAKGRAAFENRVRARYESVLAREPSTPPPGARESENLRRRLADVLRAVYVAQGDVAKNIAFAERTGIGAADCHAIATMLTSRRRREEAIGWVERGLRASSGESHVTSARHDLVILRRQLLAQLGRAVEALGDAWGDFKKRPSTYSYNEFMKFVPRTERPVWHEKAMHAVTGADFGSRVELLIETKEIQRLANLIDRTEDGFLEGESHHVTEPAAKMLERVHPGAAARLWRAQGMRIVNAAKSKYYGAANRNFVRAKRCFARAGLVTVWEKIVLEVRRAHRRKSGFMPGFERIVLGSPPDNEPSFLDRAEGRWGERHADNGR